MRYYYQKPEDGWEMPACAHAKKFNHMLYDTGTVFRANDKGLVVIQQRYNHKQKISWWGSIDPWIAYDIYWANGFWEYFHKMSAYADENGLYPTVTVRQIMYALHMKPLPKEPWETTF